MHCVLSFCIKGFVIGKAALGFYWALPISVNLGQWLPPCMQKRASSNDCVVVHADCSLLRIYWTQKRCVITIKSLCNMNCLHFAYRIDLHAKKSLKIREILWNIKSQYNIICCTRYTDLVFASLELRLFHSKKQLFRQIDSATYLFKIFDEIHLSFSYLQASFSLCFQICNTSDSESIMKRTVTIWNQNELHCFVYFGLFFCGKCSHKFWRKRR